MILINISYKNFIKKKITILTLFFDSNSTADPGKSSIDSSLVLFCFKSKTTYNKYIIYYILTHYYHKKLKTKILILIELYVFKKIDFNLLTLIFTSFIGETILL